VCEWIPGAWHSVFPEIVEKSFKVTGISNEMGGNEDFLVNDIGNESQSNDNGDDSSTGSDSE
jgi:hypothetical protein